MRVTLCFPPSWTPAMPHLALPTLAAYLRAQGITVIQRDLNVELKDTILTRAYLEETVERLREEQGSPGARHPDAAAVQWALANGNELAARIEGAKQVSRSEAFFDVERGGEALEMLIHGLQLASLPFYPAFLDLSTFTSPVPEGNSRELLAVVRDPQRNPFLELFRHGIVADLLREPPDVVGISVPTAAQFLAALTLAAALKDAGLPSHITLGGPHITVLRDQFANAPALFDLFDSAIVFAGERPLLRLAEALAGDGALRGVPNLLYREGERLRRTAREEGEPLDKLPPPDFDGLPLERYFTPGLVLPMLTSRGCYHHRCAFCNVGYGEPESFQQLDPEQVVEQMIGVSQRYPVKHIWFADEAVTPRNLRQMGPLLEAQGAPIEWSAYVRFDRALSRDLLAGIQRGGCRMLFFGLESASPKIMQAMCKSIELPVVRRILHDSAELGLWNHLFFFFGFPGETVENAQETVNFLYEEKAYIHSVAFGTFVLERYAPVQRQPARYGVREVAQLPGHDLALVFNYQVREGMDEKTAGLVSSALLDALPQKPYGHLYVHDVYRILHAQRLQRQGVPYPPWVET